MAMGLTRRAGVDLSPRITAGNPVTVGVDMYLSAAMQSNSTVAYLWAQLDSSSIGDATRGFPMTGYRNIGGLSTSGSVGTISPGTYTGPLWLPARRGTTCR